MELETLLLKIYVLENIDKNDIINGNGIYPKHRIINIVNDFLELKLITKIKANGKHTTDEGEKELNFLLELLRNKKLIAHSI